MNLDSSTGLACAVLSAGELRAEVRSAGLGLYAAPVRGEGLRGGKQG